MPALTPTECQAVTAALTYETGRYQEPIYTLTAWRSPIIALTNQTRKPWTDGLGVSHNVLTYGRSFPTALTAGSWTNVTPSDGNNANACLPPVIDTGFAQTTRTTNLRHLAIETPYFCIEDIRNAMKFREQLDIHNRILADVSWWVWRDRYYTDYYTTAQHKISINQASGLLEDASAYPATGGGANGELQQYHLQQLALNYVIREGGMDAPARDMDTNAPVIELILSQEMSDHLIRNNPELRQDVRYAMMGEKWRSPLMPDFYAKRRSFGGFTHNIEAYPRRFNIVNGVYVEVPVWDASTTTIGDESVINPDWLTAQAEEVIMWMPNVWYPQVPVNIAPPAPGWAFAAQTYMGQFTARNIPERECNPDENQIFWRARFASSATPINPRVGVAILAARCPYPLATYPCNYAPPTGNGGYTG